MSQTVETQKAHTPLDPPLRVAPSPWAWPLPGAEEAFWGWGGFVKLFVGALIAWARLTLDANPQGVDTAFGVATDSSCTMLKFNR